MKTRILLSMALLCLNVTGISQELPDYIYEEDPVNIAYKKSLSDLFENVDLKQVPSGILLEHGFPFIDLEFYNGLITAGTKGNNLAFGLAYASIASMAVDLKSNLPDPKSYRSVFDTISPSSPIIPVAGLHQVYHTIDSTAVHDGLFTLVDSNFHDVPDRARSPYIRKELFLFAPAELKTNNSSFSFYFDSKLFYSNTGKSIASLKLDIGKGQGFQTILFNQPIPLSFPEKGRYDFIVELSYTDGTVYYARFDIIVLQTALRGVAKTPDIFHYIHSIPPNIKSLGRGGGSINVFLACGHERIEKPFIWAEAFNPSIGIVQANLDSKDILERIMHSDAYVNDISLFDHLTENGYDIIVLDYENGTDYLPRTAEFIKEAIRWVNLQKFSAGSRAKNIILGQSMGGVCTMQALREMENMDEDHECETFIIFDSPIQGVNIPLAAQASLLDMSTVVVNRFLKEEIFLFKFVKPIEDLLDLYYAPATRTMMTEQVKSLHDVDAKEINIQGKMAGFGFDTKHLYKSHYNYLHGEMGGMPEKCEVIALANGSANGASGQHYFSPGDLILHASGNNFVVGSIVAGLIKAEISDDVVADIFDSPIMSAGLGVLMWTLGISAKIDIKYYAMKSAVLFKYYSHESKVQIGLKTIIAHSKCAFQNFGLEIDHAAGGFFGIQNQGVFIPKDMKYVDPLKIFKLNTWCFTPTGSVLNYYESGTSNNWTTDVLRPYNNPSYDITNNLTRGIDGYLANTSEPEFPANPGVKYKNTAHTWFTKQQARYIHYNLIGTNEIDFDHLSYGKTYNFGKSALTPDTDYETSLPIRTGALLEASLTVNASSFNVNANGPIGVSPSPYAPEVLGNTMENSHFVMYLGPLCDMEKVTLTLENTSEMDIGDGLTRTGSVLVGKNHEIIVISGSVLTIKSGSTLKLNEGGILTIQNGGTVIIEDQASLITEYGSKINYHNGAAIELNGHSALLQLEGVLHLHENAEFRPTHEGYSSGIINIGNPDGTLIAETGSKFKIIGNNNEDPFLKILENGRLILPAILDECSIRNAMIVIRSEHKEPIKCFARLTTSNTTFVVQDNLAMLGQHPVIGLYNKSYIKLSTFKNVVIYSDLFFREEGVSLIVLASDFDFNYNKAVPFIRMVNGNINIQNTTFQNYSNKAVFLEGLTSYSQITNSIFKAEPTSSAYGVYTTSDNEFMIRGTTFISGNVGVYNNQGLLSLKCNNFTNISQMGVFVSTRGRLEMSAQRKMGYNMFNTSTSEHVVLQNADYLGIAYGYNYFADNGPGVPTIGGTVSYSPKPLVAYQADFNKWKAGVGAYSSEDIVLTKYKTPIPVNYYGASPLMGSCGQYDPSRPPLVPINAYTADLLPRINFGPGILPTIPVRLDSAFIYAVSTTKQWRETNSDLVAIGYFCDILNAPYTPKDLANTDTKHYLDLTYNALKYTIGHAVSDSVILKAHNAQSFNATIQKYVNVLNALTVADTFGLEDYKQRFSLEMDKANLFRMLGHTQTGFEILLNLSDCDLDSSDRIALNQMLFIYEEETVKQSLGLEGYRSDTVYTDAAKYPLPYPSQANFFYFGSVIDNLNTIHYRSCSGFKQHIKDEETRESVDFNLFPNPTDGVVNLTYNVPAEGKAEVVVYGVNGQVVYRAALPNGSGQITMNLSFVQSGMYLYTVFIDEQIQHSGRISVTN